MAVLKRKRGKVTPSKDSCVDTGVVSEGEDARSVKRVKLMGAEKVGPPVAKKRQSKRLLRRDARRKSSRVGMSMGIVGGH